MRQEVQQVIDRIHLKQNEQKKARELAEKNRLLEHVGLYEIEYASRMNSPEQLNLYPYSETVDGVTKRYRKIYLDVTDEEYQALKDAVGTITEEKEQQKERFLQFDADISESCTLAKILCILAVVLYFSFFILGFVMGNSSVTNVLSGHREFSFGTAFIYWIAGVFSGTLLLGFSDIVDQQHKQTELLASRLIQK